MGTCFACLRTTRKPALRVQPKSNLLSAVAAASSSSNRMNRSKSELGFHHADGRQQVRQAEFRLEPEVAAYEHSPYYDEFNKLDSNRSEVITHPQPLNDSLFRRSSGILYHAESYAAPDNALNKSRFYKSKRDDKESNHNSSTRHQYEEPTANHLIGNDGFVESPINPTIKGIQQKLKKKLNHFASIYENSHHSMVSNSQTPSVSRVSSLVKQDKRSGGSDRELKRLYGQYSKFEAMQLSIGQEFDSSRFVSATGNQKTQSLRDHKTLPKLLLASAILNPRKSSKMIDSPKRKLETPHSPTKAEESPKKLNQQIALQRRSTSLRHKMKLQAAVSALRSFFSKDQE